MASSPRVRFAPSPTGFMHIGNVRTALFNYLFARQKNGTFILRIEDTDPQRNMDLGGVHIMNDLTWLGLSYDEGPMVGGEHGPYAQSERTTLYQEKLDELISAQKVYRCFCTAEDLEQKRQRQIALKKPPRYDRTCLKLSDDMIKQKIANDMSFIWRLQVNHDATVEIESMARGKMRFELKNFSDFALTRPDGSFTFMFANFIDDWLMEITHVFRGEDHLSNTAMQAALFDSFLVTLPKFWHLPFMCNTEGKKLSKRDFGFSLEDLKKEGFLPEAICNYLVVAGGSFEQEVQSLDELSQSYNFDNIHSTGAIRYDVQKLRWFNHKWLMRLSDDEFLKRAKPFLENQLQESKAVGDEKLRFLVKHFKENIHTLTELADCIRFYFETPKVDRAVLEKEFGQDMIKLALEAIAEQLANLDKEGFFYDNLKAQGAKLGIKPRALWSTVRYLLTGSFQGAGIHELLEMIETEELARRLSAL